MDKYIKVIFDNLYRQLNNFWSTSIEECDILLTEQYLLKALKKTIACINSTSSKYSLENSINFLNTSQFSIFLYYLSNFVGGGTNKTLADKLYYLNKIMHSVDWYWAIELPDHFYVEHPLGSVLGRAEYGDYLLLYQGTTIGGNHDKNGIHYPKLGDYVILYANSTLIGNCHVGSKVVFSANAYVKDEVIPDYSIVSGSSPNLIIRKITEDKMNVYFNSIWKM